MNIERIRRVDRLAEAYGLDVRTVLDVRNRLRRGVSIFDTSVGRKGAGRPRVPTARTLKIMEDTRRLAGQGKSQSEIGRELGFSREYIRQLTNKIAITP